MFRVRHLIAFTLFSILLGTQALAQSEAATQAVSAPAPAVTASASAEAIRFTSPEQVLQMRVEIYSANGELIFDSGLHQGNILDWKTTNSQQPLMDGSYLCIVTVKDLGGRPGQRFGAVTVQAGQVSVQRAREEQLTPAQSQALAASRHAQKIEAASSDTSLTIVRETTTRAATITAHDGQDGQVTSTTGALTFRTGDTLANRDQEHMRITPEGRVGIGTNRPEATLDVDGTIRARGGIVFDDGTVLNSAPRAAGTSNVAAVAETKSNTAAAAVAGTGTTNTLTKWTDTTGTLGDSVITEANGNVGIGTATPVAPLVVSRAQNSGTTINVDNGHTEAGNFAYSGFFFKQANANRFFFGSINDGNTLQEGGPGAAVLWNYVGPILFAANNVERMRLSAAGNLGIGMNNPQFKLDVAGDVRIAGGGNGLIFPDGTKLTTANGGSQMTGTSIITAINSASTTGSISDARLSPNLARLGSANNWTGVNNFSLGLSAGGAQVSNVANPVAAGDAVNKAYLEATTIRFVPAAPQLSVGDANGTAAMLSLRGGSTCCSGPSGFTPADFRVYQNGSFLATGNLGIGTIPVEGKGYRTMWYTYKGAFRSGYADNEWDDANVGFFSWAGGSNSTASGLYAFAFGDTNFASSTSSIVFGSGNEVKGAAGFSAGAGNRVCDTYGVAFGNKAQSGGPLINGRCDPDTFNIRGLAAVAMGYNVTADQDHTTALGKFASNNGFSGTFIWSDGSATATADTFRNTANNEFAARATGGFRFRTNLGGTTGCNLPAGSGVFNCTSSRATKENFLAVRGEEILSSLRAIPVSTWNYISEGRQVRHMGPMAEDFYQAFRLGTGNTSIGVQDLAGVSIAAVKALEERTAQLQQKIAEVERLRAQLNTLEQRFAALEQFMQANGNATRTAEAQ